MGLLMEQGVSDCGVDLERGDVVSVPNAGFELVVVGGGSCEGPLEDVKAVVDWNECVFEKKLVQGKAASGKKHPKPPRPPRGVSLDSADQKIIRELAEMARLKRARIERMKALKRMKEAKTSSSKNQLFATLFTVFFFLIILCQGISSRISPAATLQGSPMTSRTTDGDIISMMQLQYLSTHGYKSPSLAKQGSVSKAREKSQKSSSLR